MPSIPYTVRRADIFGYNFILMGLILIIDYGSMALTNSVTLAAIGGAGVGLFAIAAGILSHIKPDEYRKGSDPASGYLFVLAGVTTVAFIFVVLS